MFVRRIDDALERAPGVSAVLVYSTVDQDLARAMRLAQQAAPGASVFGATSFQGVFTPSGFERGAHGLFIESSDGVELLHRLVPTSAAGSAGMVCGAARDLVGSGGPPTALLVHATPGFEEQVLVGLAEAGLAEVPTYGGSAADDDLSGNWRVFADGRVSDSGVLLIALRTGKQLYGSFVSGYFGTKRSGRITRSEGRVVHTIDHRPAAEVLDEWMGGRLAPLRDAGGVALEATALSPVGRVVDRTHGVQRFLLSHPHYVHADGSVSFFTDMPVGEVIEVMMGTKASLLERTKQAVDRALPHGESPRLMGGVLVYCGGCVGQIPERTNDVCRLFQSAIRGAPFVGAATFGELGTFERARDKIVRHGNLMCSTLLVGR